MKKIFCFFLCSALFFLAVSCDGKRPDNGILEFDLMVRSLQKNASVEVLSEERAVLSGHTDENGIARFESVRNIGGLKIKVCGGTVDLVSSKEAVAWNGCMEKSVRAAEEAEVTAVVDFLSTFIERYRSDVSQKEWFDYLDISGDVFPELQTSLTDATKRYLWHQAFSKIAETVSVANNTSPETQFSTENLLLLLSEDLSDDNVINGSTYAKFGSAIVSAAFMKGLMSDFLSEVSEKFSAAELKEWSEKIRTSQAEFLGGEDGGESGISIEISVYPEGNKGAEVEYFSGAVAVEAKAEPENMIVTLNCAADGEKLADKDEDAASFQGSFTTENIEDEKDVVIRCEASNGITVGTAEKTISVNNDAPSIQVYFYRHGTLEPTGSADDPAKKSVDIKVEAAHKRYVVEELSCSLENYAMVNTSDTNYQYKAVVDTTKLPDGKNILECTASVERKKYKAVFPFYTKNTVTVKVRPFVTAMLHDFDSVSVSCGDAIGNKTSDSLFSSGDEIKVKLGEVCLVTVNDGIYEPVVSENAEASKRLNGALSAVFIPTTDEDVIVTPLTTIGAYIFLSRRDHENVSDEELYHMVLEHLSMHLSHAFEWNEIPSNTNAADSRTKYFILLAGLEYLAYFMETDIGSEHGIYDISNVLRLLQEDYKDNVFNGKNGETQLFFGDDAKKKALDANFFRYYYALSIKRFLTGPFNETVFTQLGSVVSNIASNSDQFLFPAESAPVPVDSAGPKIDILGFHDLFATDDEENLDIIGDLGNYTKGEVCQYDPQNGVMPHFAKAFLFKFKVSPQEGSFIDLNSVALKSKDPGFVFRVKRIKPQSIDSSGFLGESSDFTMLAEYSDEGLVPMEKELPFSLSAQDIAYNTAEKDVTVFLDNKKPSLHLDYPEGTVRTEDVEVSWSVSDSMIESVKLTLSKWEDEETVVFEDESESCSSGKCFMSSEVFAEALALFGLEGSAIDGLYKITLSAVDHAGNRSTLYGSFTVDTTPPEIPLVRVESDGRVLLKNSVTNKNYLTVSLIDPDEDIKKWAVKLSCSVVGGTVSQEKTLGYADTNETLEFFNLLATSNEAEVVKCTGFVSVCDEIGNCANDDFSEPIGSVFIDSQPPRFVSYDRNQSIFTECIDSASSFNIGPCKSGPNCSPYGFVSLNKAKPQLLFTYEDNLSSPENLRVFIHSAENGWLKSCQYIANQDGELPGNCDKFYCDLEGSVNGINNFSLTAYDIVGNRSEHTLAVSMDFSPVEPLKVNLTDRFFTSKWKNYLWWETKSGVEYKCTITKQGDSSFSTECSNNSDILPSQLSGSGYYTVSVESKSATTQRTDVAEFKFFDVSDLDLSLEPQKGQFIHSGDQFKVKVTADSGNMAEISKVELYLYGRYLNGVLQDSSERLILSRNYTTAVSSLNAVFFPALSVETPGQFRNMKIDITFSDTSHYIKKFTNSSANAFLYCLLSSNETADTASLSFKNKALNVSFEAPKCLAASDYTMTLNAYYPSECDGLDISGSSISATKNYANDFTVKGDFVFFKNEHHSHEFDCVGTACSEVVHSCAAQTHNFSSETDLKVAYSCGKSFVVKGDASVQCTRSESEVAFYDEDGDYDEYDNKNCKKCRNKLNQPANCFGGKRKIVTLE